MRAIAIFLVVAICLLGAVSAQADPAVESVQQVLKDQGFYYGEITGTKDTETTAALRRFQIRNGLQVTGELNAETRKSLGVGGAPVPRATPPSAPVIPKVAPPRVEPDTSDLRDDETIQEGRDERGRELQPAPAPRGERLFDGTPYENAPPEVQQEVIVGAQAFLARRGYYRSGVDGVFGSGTAFALRAYQTRSGLEPSGVLDMETLALLGLLPEQRTPGLMAPRPRIYRRPAVMFTPDGERIYIPR